MKRMQCEVCGGVDITKVDDTVFQCSSCGCKYTVEQARGLLQEITGTVEVSNIANVDNLITKAFMEFEAGSINASNDFKRALELNPNDIRAWIGLMLGGQRVYYYEKIKALSANISTEEVNFLSSSEYSKKRFLHTYLLCDAAERVAYFLQKPELKNFVTWDEIIKCGAANVIAFAVKSGFNPNEGVHESDKKKWRGKLIGNESPLGKAILWNCDKVVDIVRALLAHGANPNIYIYYGNGTLRHILSDCYRVGDKKNVAEITSLLEQYGSKRGFWDY